MKLRIEIRQENGNKTEISLSGRRREMPEGSNGHRKIFFGEFRLEIGSRTLWRDDREIHLPKRPFDVLRFLIENRERVVSRKELIDKFWEGHDVYDDALRKTVAAVRHALEDNNKPPHFIETRYGGGYRFIADAEALDSNGSGFSNGGRPAVLNSHTPAPGKYRNAGAIAAMAMISVCAAAYFFWPRPQSAAPQPGLVESAANIRSIAVMPIKNLTGDISNEYFSDGITESVITQLSRVGELRIISRSSTFIYKGKEIDPREVGRQLGVDAILEGGVQKIGANVNIRVRLVSTKDGTVIWTSNDYERPVTNAYDLQDLIAGSVAAELRTELSEPPAGRKTNDGFAYQEYLKGRFEWNKRTGDGIKRSIEHYKKAIAFDPKYALAYAGVADSYAQGIWHVPFDENAVLPLAKEAALHSLALDEPSAEAHTALASVLSHEWDWAGSERELARAIEIDPRYARAYHVQAFAFMIKGRYDESIESINRAEELDPLNLVIQTDKGELLWSADRVDEAFEQWRKTLELDPNFSMALEHRAAAYEVLGHDSAAIDDFAAVMKMNGQAADKIAVFRQKAARAGLSEFRRRELRDMLSFQKPLEPVWHAYLQSLTGQTDKAFRSLDTAFHDHSAKIVLIASPMFRRLSSDRRFDDLMKRTGLR